MNSQIINEIIECKSAEDEMVWIASLPLIKAMMKIGLPSNYFIIDPVALYCLSVCSSVSALTPRPETFHLRSLFCALGSTLTLARLGF